VKVAYFSMEFAVDDRLPIYAGGLGVLAGDHLKSSSDLGLPLVAVGLLYRQGYFTQVIDEDGRQREEYPEADLSGVGLVKENVSVGLELAGETVRVDVWRLDVGSVPLYLLESDALVPRLYTIDREERIRQEVVIGVGGVLLAAQPCRGG
jgi:starch phosphorylase